MGFLENVSLVNQIKVFTTFRNTNSDEQQVNESSNLNQNDPLLFLLDLVSLILGSGFLRTILAGFLSDLLVSLDGEVKNFIKGNNTTENSNGSVGAFNLSVPMSLIDFNDNFKIDPSTLEGRQIQADPF